MTLHLACHIAAYALAYAFAVTITVLGLCRLFAAADPQPLHDERTDGDISSIETQGETA